MTVPTPPSPDESAPLEWLRGEVERWQREGLVRPEQAQSLLARYGLLPGETPRTLHHSRIIYLLAALGAVLVGVGIILLVGANWQLIPKWVRLAVILGVTLAAYHGGFVLAYRRKTYPKLGLALLLIGSLCWGAGIFLIGQMYHLSGGGAGGETKAVLYWFLGVLPLAYVLISPLHMLLALVLGSIWFGMVLGDFAYLGAQASLVVLLGAGILLYALGRLQASAGRTARLEAPWRWLGLLYIFGALYAFSFRDFWEWSADMRVGPQWFWPKLVLDVAGPATILLLLTRARRTRTDFAEGTALLLLLLLGVAIVAQHPAWFTATGIWHYYAPLWQGSYTVMALFNLLLLAAVVGVIALGWARHQPGLVTFGLFVFFVQVVTRYFDLLGGMLSGGLMFVGAGLLLLGAGWALEYSRRKPITAMAERRPT